MDGNVYVNGDSLGIYNLEKNNQSTVDGHVGRLFGVVDKQYLMTFNSANQAFIYNLYTKQSEPIEIDGRD